MRVLINSYACCPGLGSEPGMGWNWIISLAQHCECFVISEGEFRLQVEQWLASSENKSVAQHIHFYWLPIGGDNSEKCERIREMCRNQGDWRFYYYYRLWQKRVAALAEQIIEEQAMKNAPIQVLHQLNMIGFREPGYLWKVSRATNIPLVWGPTNAKDGFPMAYAKSASIRQKVFLCIKNAITRLQLSLSPRVRMMANTADVIVAASSDAQQSIEKYWHKSSICINETGCSAPPAERETSDWRSCEDKENYDILWCGRMLFSKQLDIAIRAVAAANTPNMVLHIVGSGDDKPYRQLADALSANVRWHGQILHDEVQNMMRRMDVLLFTSVFEGTPHVVLEAIENQLPVVCHKTCGQGDLVTDSVGITCPVVTPEKSVKDFAEALKHLYTHKELLDTMRSNCVSHAQQLTWDKKAQQMISVYKTSVQNRKNDL